MRWVARCAAGDATGTMLRETRKVAIDGSAVQPGPVLLVDDIVDSRWTLTVAAWLLRTHGSGEVHPFALAVASARDD